MGLIHPKGEHFPIDALEFGNPVIQCLLERMNKAPQ
jgi:hypothetical protein